MRAARAGRKLSVKAWDTNKACTNDLRKVLEAQWPRIEVDVQEGKMPVEIEATSGTCPKGADLLFIDPPNRKGGKRTLKKIDGLKSDILPLLIWLPVNGHQDKQNKKVWIPNTDLPILKTIKLSRFHVLWKVPSGTRMVVGCEILGYNLEDSTWEAALNAATEVAKTMNWCICFK